QTWEAIHVELPRRLAAAARDAGVGHMIHVSVAGAEAPPADAGPYLASKAAGEAAVREQASGSLGLTILRPGVVYGRGDDMLRNLADSTRAAPVFPAPRGGRWHRWL
ncbi:MAG: SDR family oxidoreductase, partial [Myxococcales bacterium]|nr:SDR family oxidoreductase [Myxococcales bacterium]